MIPPGSISLQYRNGGHLDHARHRCLTRSSTYESLTLPLPPSIRVTGHAIVSADGMIADAEGAIPPQLRNETDWRRFQAALDDARLVVLGRIGHQRHPNRGRRRLVLTRSIPRLAPLSEDPLVHFWNPAGAEFADVLLELGIAAGNIAVTGGTGTFDQFLDCYDRFVLAEVHDQILPGGTPCFGGGHPRVALAAAGLVPAQPDLIDWDASVTETVWRRIGR